MGFTDWLTGQTKKGLVPMEEDQRDYNKHYADYYKQYIIDPSMPITKTSAVGPSTGSVALPPITTTTGASDYATQIKAYQQMVTNSTGSTFTSNSWDNWTKDEKKLLAKIGFKYDKKKKDWVLRLSSEIRIPQQVGFEMLMQGTGDKPSQQAVAKMKQLKEMIIEKITAKLILSELVKPREVKE